jgi:outer membrane protein assembly factor BamE (lipoprotein component of BamABCDE complex)
MKTVLLVVLGIMVLAGVALSARRLLAPDLTVFDKDRWAAEAQAKPSENKRSLMTKDLEKRLRQGMSEDEIIALMGQPDSRRDTRFIYNLGTPGFGVDYDHYVIEFDANHKVTRYFTDRG